MSLDGIVASRIASAKVPIDSADAWFVALCETAERDLRASESEPPPPLVPEEPISWGEALRIVVDWTALRVAEDRFQPAEWEELRSYRLIEDRRKRRRARNNAARLVRAQQALDDWQTPHLLRRSAANWRGFVLYGGARRDGQHLRLIRRAGSTVQRAPRRRTVRVARRARSPGRRSARAGRLEPDPSHRVDALQEAAA